MKRKNTVNCDSASGERLSGMAARGLPETASLPEAAAAFTVSFASVQAATQDQYPAKLGWSCWWISVGQVCGPQGLRKLAPGRWSMWRDVAPTRTPWEVLQSKARPNRTTLFFFEP